MVTKKSFYPVALYWSHWRDGKHVEKAYIIETREMMPLFHW